MNTIDAPAPSDDDSETPEFHLLCDGAMEGLGLVTAAHQNTWHLGEEESWDFSQQTGELIFTFPEMTVRAAAQIIGTFDTESETWLWSWANESIAEALTADARRVRAYGEERGIERLRSANWPAEEIDGWVMTALACRLNESGGAYRGPAGSAYVFFTFGQVKMNRRT